MMRPQLLGGPPGEGEEHVVHPSVAELEVTDSVAMSGQQPAGDVGTGDGDDAASPSAHDPPAVRASAVNPSGSPVRHGEDAAAVLRAQAGRRAIRDDPARRSMMHTRAASSVSSM